MKISNILTCAIVSILVISCAKKPISQSVKNEQPMEIDPLTTLQQQTEHNNPFVVDAKIKLLQFVGDSNFNNYITKHGILACNGNENQTSCVLNFYLQEYYKLKYDVQIKRIIEENQTEHDIELSKIEATQINIDKYCKMSADFVAAIYNNDKSNITKKFQPLFRMTEQNMSTLYTKVSRDSYSHFLIDENPSMLQEMKADYVEKCLDNPKDNIINYFNLFR
ncbi:hypothetical protein A9G13_03375 [Gilliamella sp. wkB178]|uniref:hypothetical protein n=1 Tax=Gilliamella sp. wkB178 TaxID=3120259 RepID=UPI00080E5333|nr:hypothetical protein [Gilliamella apicola]OCG09106.1 hypothetical protein A9G13_03375 [Gilliamella apicola]